MVTIKDIAKRAGVSHGTVSNVLNRRGNVSMKKILLVEQAARELGYSIDERSKQLRQEFERSISVVLPNLREEKYTILYTAVSQRLSEQGYRTVLYLTGDIPAKEEACLNEIAGRRCQGVILVTCQPQGSEARSILQKNGVIVVAVERRAEGLQKFIGFDSDAIVRKISHILEDKQCKHVSVITGLLTHSNESEFLEKLTEILSLHSINVRSYQTDSVNASVAAFSVCTDSLLPDAVVATSPRFCDSLIDACAFCNVDSPLLLSLTPTGVMPSGNPVKRVELNWKHLAALACSEVLSAEHSQATLLPPEQEAGFMIPSVSIPVQINVLMLDGPESRALSKLLPDFTKHTGIDVRMVVSPYDELYNTIRTMGCAGYYDVIRMDVAWMDSLAKGRLLPYDPSSPEICPIFEPMLPSVRHPFSVARGIPCAFPFTPNVQMHFYRRDLFEDNKTRRAFFEQYRDSLTLALDFKEYCRLLEFFSREKNPGSPVEAGAAVVSNSISGIVCEFLPVFFASGGKLFNDAGQPSLCTPEAEEALEIYLKMVNSSIATPAGSWWSGAVKQFVNGKTAMMNMFINHLSDITDLRKSKIAGRIGFGSVPGQKPLLGGGVLGISESSQKKEAALDFIRWACSEHLSRPFTLLGGISPCSSVYSCEDLLDIYPWLSAVPENFDLAVTRKVPDKLDEYLMENILGQSIKNAIYHICSPKEALAFAQKQLEEYL